MDVVDARLARTLLELLGYSDTDWEYNRNKAAGRPDYLVAPDGRVAFFLEDKRTGLDLVLPDLEEQLRRYSEGLVPRGLVFNGREILAVHLVDGKIAPTLRVNLANAAGLAVDQQQLIGVSDEESYGLLHELFHRTRFVELQPRIDRLACNESEWEAQARPINERADAFADSAARLIVRLAHVARLALEEHLTEYLQFQREMDALRGHVTNALHVYHAQGDARAYADLGNLLVANIGHAPRGLVTEIVDYLPNAQHRRRLRDQLEALSAQAQQLELRFEESLEVARRYEGWLNLERRFEAAVGEENPESISPELEANRRWRFARQSAYVFFLKMCLIRILEDKRLLERRLITDGGLSLWVNTVRQRFAPHVGPLSAAPLIELALGQAAAFSRDVRRRDVYDWFQPDDSTILDTLEVLHPYNFGSIATDVIGYAYQRFLEATERHQIGHYLTPPAVVDHILDVAQYTAANREIIGRKLLDPACGSGSFLVHAAARYKEALADAYPDDRITAAEEFLRAIQEFFLGIDINPFSCYLARINLLVQALDDVAFLRSQARVPPVTDLQIFNGDSLDFRGFIGGQEMLSVEHSDAVLQLKAREAGRLMYVVGNPPYINIKQENLQLNDLRALPFFAEWLHGDANTYLLFLRIGLHFLAPGGVLAFIVPGTVLGDQQAETFRRNIIRQGYALRRVTRFYTERVLFKPVEQATCVLAITRDASGDIQIRGGGTAATSQEAVEDVLARPEIQLPESSVWIWVNSAAPPVLAVSSPPQPVNNWALSWSVIPERTDYYNLLRRIASASGGTVATLLRDLGLDLDTAFRQGDVNTTHISPFHVPANTEHAMPLYKGEEVDQLVPFVYEPASGPKGRTPYLRPDESLAVNANHRVALDRLRRIADLRESEHGFVLHEIGGLRVKRAIAGTWFERGNGARMVFPHTLWVVRGFRATDGKALLGLLTSLVMNFLYHAISTNDHVSRTLLATFPVPVGFREVRDRLASLVDAALEAGSQLIATLARYGVSRSRAMRTGEPTLDPVAVLSGSSIVTTDIRTWRARGLITVSDASSLERFTVATAFRRGALAPGASVSQTQRYVLGLWMDTYGERRWSEFERLTLPDNADAFVTRWESAQREIASRVRARHET